MKRNYIFICMLIFLSVACTDLEENAISILAPESFFSNKDDAEAAVMGAYADLNSYYDYGVGYFSVVEYQSDLVTTGTTSQENMDIDKFTVTSSNSKIARSWRYIYQSISSANNAIDGIPLINDASMSDDDKNQLIAEAKAIRAFNYFRLVRLFGDLPYIDEFVTDPSTVAEVSRTSTDKVYTNIVDDLEFAKQYLPDSYSGNFRNRISKGTAYTILADVYLTLENWSKAAENAEYVIDHALDFGYELVADFRDLYDASLGDVAEDIWTVDFVANIYTYPYNYDAIATLVSVKNSDYNGWSTAVSTKKALESFDDRDYRKKITFCVEAPYNGVMKPYTEFLISKPHIYKYFLAPGGTSADFSDSDLNMIIYRYAEILLIAAEASNEINGGPTTKAYDFINQVRARARNYDGVQTEFPMDLEAGMSQTEFRDAVMEERRVELAFEYKRWFDIIRRDLFMEVFTGENSTDPHTDINESHMLFPIPQTEIDKNPNLTQNPGY